MRWRCVATGFPGRGARTFRLSLTKKASLSGLPLIFRQDNAKADAAGQFEEHELARSLSPLLFCYTDKEQPAM